MIRGAVHRIDLGRPRGHEQGGRRYGVIVSPTESPLSVVTVVPTSTSARPALHRPDLEIAGSRTRILIDRIRSIDTALVGEDPSDFLTRDQMAEVDAALARYLGIVLPAG